jgi:GNAT superfamily N-acetyltransferase
MTPDRPCIAVAPLVPVRPSDESWELERKEMLEALAGDAFALVARRRGDAVFYLFVRVEGPDPVWYTGATHAELAHLSVAEGTRGHGVGGALMDAMDAELERRGVEDVEIGVARSLGRPVILLDTWELSPPEGGQLDGVRRAQTPAEAVELALA